MTEALSARRRNPRTIRYRPHVYKYSLDNNPNPMDIVFSIINGNDIHDVDPQLFSQITPLLQEKEKQLREWRNQPASKFVEQALSYIQNYRYSEDPNQMTGIVTRSDSKKDFSEEDIAFSVNLALHRQDYWSIDPSMHKSVIKELKNIRVEALKNNDYALAEKCENATRKLISIESDAKYEDILTSKADQIENKYHIALKELQNLKEQQRIELNMKRSEMEQKVKELESSDESRLKSFDSQFDTEPPLEMQKFSPELLQLKRREKYMVLAKRYSEATQINEEIKQLEKIEREQQKNRWIAELKLKKRDLSKTLKEKREARVQSLEMGYIKLVQQYESELDHATKTADHLKTLYESLDKECQKTIVQTKKSRQIDSNESSKSIAGLFRQKARINAIVYTRSFSARKTQSLANPQRIM